MSELRDLLEERRRRFTMPEHSLLALQRRQERRRNRQIFAGALALLIAGAGVGGLYGIRAIGKAPSGGQLSKASSGGTPGEASCVFIAKFEGRTYVGVGVDITPIEGSPLGSAVVPGCDDTGGPPPPSSKVRVSSFPGLPASIALVIPGNDQTVLVRAGLRELPPAVAALVHAPSCQASDEPIRLTGQWQGILGADGKTELDLIPPYDVYIQVASSSNVRYQRARLTVRVPRSLGRPISHTDIENSLWKGGSIAITATCDGSRFIATDVQVQVPVP
jgi:Family of unknown function (DUF6281)